jgi:hypothetical protein
MNIAMALYLQAGKEKKEEALIYCRRAIVLLKKSEPRDDEQLFRVYDYQLTALRALGKTEAARKAEVEFQDFKKSRNERKPLPK